MIMHKSTRNTRAKRGEERKGARDEEQLRQQRDKRERKRNPARSSYLARDFSLCLRCARVCTFLSCSRASSKRQHKQQQLLFPSQQFVARGLFGHCDRGKVGAFFGQQAIKDGDDRDVIAGASII